MNSFVLNATVVLVKPSKLMIKFIKNLKLKDELPENIRRIKFNQKCTSQENKSKNELLINNDDINSINGMNLDNCFKVNRKEINFKCHNKNGFLINLDDCKWLYNIIVKNNKTNKENTYFHEIFEGSQVILPKNSEVPRNPELEKRCEELKACQANRVYKKMTKNVDSFRASHPEDTIAYQMKQIKSQLIAVAQFMVSILAGFAFGFLGVELLIGKLDPGFRLLLAIICALITALAELYFLTKKLNEDLEFTLENRKPFKSKLRTD